jgi:hypothetical protein
MSTPKCPGCGVKYGEGLVDDNLQEWCERCGYNWHADKGIINYGNDQNKIEAYDRNNKRAIGVNP